MNELLQNEAVQTALVVVIVTALNALVAWLKLKFPSQSARVEANWCYIQPAVESAMAATKDAVEKSSYGGNEVARIVSKALTEFSDAYRKLEGKDASAADIKAARVEIITAVDRVIGG